LLAGVTACDEEPSRPGPRLGDSPAIQGLDDDWDEGASLSPYITNGTFDPAHPTVGILASGSARCSATLIGQRTVLTAGHCVKTTSVSFTVEGQKYASAQVIRHPGYAGGNQNDLAVVILQQSVVGVAPSPVNTSPVQVGQSIILVGYGKTGEYSGGFGTKRVGHNSISSVGSTTFKFKGQSNVCNGDSGGPTFVLDSNGQELVAGVHSTKSGVCGSGGTDMRVDAYQQWITTVAGGDVAKPGAGSSPAPPPQGSSPAPPPTGLSGEGQSCASQACAQGLACVTVFGAGYAQIVGQYCMETCQDLGADPACDGNEVCTQSKTAGRVCFDANNPQQGYTSPQPASPPSSPNGSCHPGSPHGWSYCTKACPCSEGEGDCDSDAECTSGLVCRHNVGASIGKHPSLDLCGTAAGSPPPSPQQPPPSSPSAGAKEGESCASAPCEANLACVTVFTAGYAKVAGQYCMEKCQTLGSDPACDGGEVCVQSKTAGRVCFNAQNPQQGYTSPGGGAAPPPSGPGPTPPPGGTGPCGFNGEEADVFKLLNQERAAQGVGSLQCDAKAVLVARAHSQDMCDRHYFSHYTPDGKSPWDRLKAGGVSYSAAGENIAWGQTTPKQVHNAWMSSSGHKKNMLNPSWVRTGIGYVKCTGKPFWTEVFMK